LVTKIFKDEWYVVIKAYKFTVFEISFCIIMYCMFTLSLHIESADSTIELAIM